MEPQIILIWEKAYIISPFHKCLKGINPQCQYLSLKINWLLAPLSHLMMFWRCSFQGQGCPCSWFSWAFVLPTGWKRFLFFLKPGKEFLDIVEVRSSGCFRLLIDSFQWSSTQANLLQIIFKDSLFSCGLLVDKSWFYAWSHVAENWKKGDINTNILTKWGN